MTSKTANVVHPASRSDFVIFHEKYGDVVYSLSTTQSDAHFASKLEVWSAICLKVVTSRLKQGFFGTRPKESSLQRPPKVDPSATLQVQRAQLEAFEDWENHGGADDLRLWKDLDIVVDLSNPEEAASAALRVIASRSREEYEGFTFDTFQKV